MVTSAKTAPVRHSLRHSLSPVLVKMFINQVNYLEIEYIVTSHLRLTEILVDMKTSFIF